MQGTSASARAWLTDGRTEVTVTGPVQGVIAVQLVPQTVGTWHLYASALDACGQGNQTGLIRVVTVTP